MDSYINFNTVDDQEYILVNKLLGMLYGRLPSYAYYGPNDDFTQFWTQLDCGELDMVMSFLIDKEYVDLYFYDDSGNEINMVDDFLCGHLVDDSKEFINTFLSICYNKNYNI